MKRKTRITLRTTALLLVLTSLLSGCGIRSGIADIARKAAAAETAEAEDRTAPAAEEVPTAEETAPAEETAESVEVTESAAAAPSDTAYVPESFNGIPEVKKSELLDIYDLDLLESCGLIAKRDGYGENYQLLDADLNVLADDSFIYLSDNNGFVDFCRDSSLNGTGLLDREGKVVIPAEYGSLTVLSDRWILGLVLKESSKDADYDFWGIGGGYYLIESVDVFYRGTKIGSLERNGYSSAEAYGDFLYLYDRDDNAHFYDSTFKESGAECAYLVEEYSYDYMNGTILHLGTNTPAFTAGCTLTPDMVKDCCYNVDGRLLDLQGNVLADTSIYHVVYSFYDGYAAVEDNAGKYGILRADGAVIAECIYDEVKVYDSFIPGGYVPAERDGKFCMVSLSDGKETMTGFAYNAMKDAFAPFATKAGDDGKYTVVTGMAGTLKDTFDEVNVPYDASPVVRVMKGDNAAVIDQAGNYVVEADGTFKDTYNLRVSNDGTLIIGETGDGFYVYKLTY